MSRCLALCGAAELPCGQEAIGDNDPVRRGTQRHNVDWTTYNRVHEETVHDRRQVADGGQARADARELFSVRDTVRSEPVLKSAGLHLRTRLRLSHDRGPPN